MPKIVPEQIDALVEEFKVATPEYQEFLKFRLAADQAKLIRDIRIEIYALIEAVKPNDSNEVMKQLNALGGAVCSIASAVANIGSNVDLLLKQQQNEAKQDFTSS